MSDWLQKMRDLEPARLRAAWAAVITVAVALGVTISADTDAIVQAAIVLFAALVPLIQGEATRAKVVPVFKAERAARRAGQTIDRLDEEQVSPADDEWIDLGGEG